MIIYGGEGEKYIPNPTANDILVLNLSENNSFLQAKKSLTDLLTWVRVKQQGSPENQINLERIYLGGDMYQGNLLILGNGTGRCWNLCILQFSWLSLIYHCRHQLMVNFPTTKG